MLTDSKQWTKASIGRRLCLAAKRAIDPRGAIDWTKTMSYLRTTFFASP